MLFCFDDFEGVFEILFEGVYLFGHFDELGGEQLLVGVGVGEFARDRGCFKGKTG